MLKPSLIIRRIDAVKEVKRTLSDRRKMWQMADQENKRFVNNDHQKQFDTMLQIGCVLAAMSDREYIDLVKKHNRKANEREQAEKDKLKF